MVAALSLYEDWVPFGAAVAFVLVQQGVTAAIVDYDRADSPWVWALVHSAFIGALSIVCLATWRASEHDREAFRSARGVARGGRADGRRRRAGS